MILALFMVAGMTAGATTSMGSHFRAVLAFNISAICPIAVYFLSTETLAARAMAVVLLVYAGMMVRQGRASERTLMRLLWQQRENLVVTESLQDKSDLLENEISVQVELANQLSEARKSAEAASHAKSEFLANMSHVAPRSVACSCFGQTKPSLTGTRATPALA